MLSKHCLLSYCRNNFGSSNPKFHVDNVAASNTLIFFLDVYSCICFVSRTSKQQPSKKVSFAEVASMSSNNPGPIHPGNTAGSVPQFSKGARILPGDCGVGLISSRDYHIGAIVLDLACMHACICDCL